MRQNKYCKVCKPKRKFPWAYRFCPFCGKPLSQEELDLKEAVKVWVGKEKTDSYFGREHENKHPDTDRLI